MLALLWALAKVMADEQSHAEMFDACWALHQPTCTCTGTWAVLPMPVTASECWVTETSRQPGSRARHAETHNRWQ
jgi:hypothetical protein